MRSNKSEGLTIYGVSVNLYDEASALYEDAARGEVSAHMVHFGESEFATIFTSTEPSVGGLKRVLKSLRSSEAPYRPSDEDHELIKFMVQEACDANGLNTDGVVFYMGPMGPEDIQQFAQLREDAIGIGQ